MTKISNDKISVITVVFNDAANIGKTIESYIAQTWENKEYIVIDGGSTDGTVEIIRKYLDRIDYFCSEKDNGIYDAMNKGISHCTGDWINILNSGDYYANEKSLEQALTINNLDETDVIYGNSIEDFEGNKTSIIASPDTNLLNYFPVYRHGSSLVRTSVHKKFLFDLSKTDKLGFALDWNMIFHVYKAGYRFRKVNCFIEVYNKIGASTHPYQSLWYNYKITRCGHIAPKNLAFFLKRVCKHFISQTPVYRYTAAFINEYVVNDILPHIPFWCIRKQFLRFTRMQIGKKSFIMKRAYIMSPSKISIGDYTDINRDSFLDARGGITIGSNVSISHAVKIITGSHDINSKKFSASYLPIIIGDYAWLGAGCTILQGVKIGNGAIVCAGAVVVHDVNPYEVVGGIPAKHIKHRTNDLDYHCIWDSPFT
ncbi:MAG TPA: glycosyl transferase family 2 [Bacteroides ovatus]|jgi:acetyltransferase-like isoleucine patch superfamily enzyme|nr:glycosyl transferase family 2 [Bacteroides ovatus]